MDHHSLMFCSGYVIFEIYFHKISKSTALKGISPHCYKKVIIVYFPQYEFPYFSTSFENQLLTLCDP